MTKPVIAVPWPRPDYLAALEQAGADVRVLRPAEDLLPGALNECDGLLLTGGEDVDPREYGASDRHSTVETDPARDAYELPLTRLALERGLPILAICRGVQVLNVAAGGTLVQDLPSAVPSSIPHQITEPKNKVAHDVRLIDETKLADLMASQAEAGGVLHVNSRHHQSVETIAPGFVASATAADGVIEAIEKPGAPFCLGVQWHPENFWRTGEFGTLFAGLVGAAQARRRA